MKSNSEARIKVSGYENIYVYCPHCGEENIFNRKSDLKTNLPILRKNSLKCQICGKGFDILSDTVKMGMFEWFFDELEYLKKNKQYRLCIINLCQGIEYFFKTAIINKLIDKNLDLRDENGLIIKTNYLKEREKLNKTKIFKLLKNKKDKKNKKFEKATFKDLRDIFIKLYEDELKDKNKNYLDEIRKTKINELRNKIIHKAYCPDLNEISEYEEIRKAIRILSKILNIRDSNYFWNKKN